MKPSAHTINKWHGQIAEYVRLYGPVIRGKGQVQFHHVKGRTFKHNKVLIGPFFVIPLPWEFHDVHSNSDLNVTHYPKRFTEVYGRQCDLWADMVARIAAEDMTLPFDETVYNAVMDMGI